MNRGYYGHCLEIFEPTSRARINVYVVEVNIRANTGLDLKGKEKKGAEETVVKKYKHKGATQTSKK
jgi:hypothetical protein